MKIKKTNQNLVNLINVLIENGYKKDAMIWVAVAKRLAKPTRRMAEVNISKINRYTKKGDTIVVPGKVLGCGDLDHSVLVSAFKFSESAKSKIEKTGKTMTIEELMKKNPKGTGVKVMG